MLWALVLGTAAPAAADWRQCRGGPDADRIAACSVLIGEPALSDGERAEAYAMRGLARVLTGDDGGALSDYDRSIELDPRAPLALNNRAWLLFRAGRFSEGAESVERALAVDPSSPHALDTRAHIRQARREIAGARADYLRAMQLGGGTFIKMYQCGLTSQGLYAGPLDGIYSKPVERALDRCLSNPGCDPLPAGEDCRDPIS